MDFLGLILHKTTEFLFFLKNNIIVNGILIIYFIAILYSFLNYIFSDDIINLEIPIWRTIELQIDNISTL